MDVPLADLLEANAGLKSYLRDVLGGGQPARWEVVAEKLQPVFKGQITGTWISRVANHNSTSPAQAAAAFLDAFCLLERGATVAAFRQGLQDASLGLAAQKLEEAALARKQPPEVGSKRGLPIGAISENGASKARRADSSSDSSDEELVLFTTSGISQETEERERSVIVERLGEDCVSPLRVLTTKNLHEILVRDGASLRIWHFSGAGDVAGQLQVLDDDKRDSCFLTPDMVYQQLKIAQMASSDELLFDYAFLSCRHAASAKALQDALRPFCRGIIGWRGDPRQYGVRFASDFYRTIAFFRSRNVEIENRHIKKAVKNARQQLPSEVKDEPFFEISW